MNKTRLSLLFFMLCNIALYSQVATGDSVSLGWSADGTTVAVAAYHLGFEGDSGSLTLIIQNLNSDTINFQDSRTWESGYDYRSGENRGEMVPYYLKEAVSQYIDENPHFNAQLDRYGINKNTTNHTPFPLNIHNDTYRISYSDRVYNSQEKTWPLVIDSDRRGKKTIADLAADQGTASKAYFQSSLQRTPFSSVQEGYRESVNTASQSKNADAFAAYSKGYYMEAEKLWEEAISLDETNHFAHFNLACVKSLLTAQDGGNRRKEILSHLEKAWNSEVYWLYKSFLDSDLDTVRQEFLDQEDVFYSPGDFGFDVHYDYKINGTFSTRRVPTSSNFRGGYGDDFGGQDPSNESMPMPEMEISESSSGYYMRICNKTVLYYPDSLSERNPSGYWAYPSY